MIHGCGTIPHGAYNVSPKRQQITSTCGAGHQAIGTASVTPWWAALVAPALEEQEADTLLAEQLRHIDTTGERWCVAEIHRLRGEIARRRRDFCMAEAHLREAIASARRQKARHWELRAARASLGSGATRASAARPALSSSRSTAPSPKAPTRSI
jgi:hypothetical protein